MYIEELLCNCSLIFDIGANVGGKTENFIRYASKVICFEPQPNCVAELQNRFQGHNQVVVVPKGIASKTGKLKMGICSEAHTISTFSEKWRTGRFSNYRWDYEIEVEVMTLDQAIDEFGLPDYCKIDVEGFEYEVLLGLSRKVPLLSFEFVIEDFQNMKKCVDRLQDLGLQKFNVVIGESKEAVFPKWVSAGELIEHISLRPEELLWGDIYVGQDEFISSCQGRKAVEKEGMRLRPRKKEDTLSRLIRAGLYQGHDPVRLHLGCGETNLEGYVNIDFPQDRHNVMRSRADFFEDITKLCFDDGVVDEIRLHHVFEHFNRVTALAMLIRWQKWLRKGGKLRIETPDIVACAKTLLSSGPLRRKVQVVRHLVGDQAADWGYHVDQWFPERFEHTFGSLGFADITIRTSKWNREPFLGNVEVEAVKADERELDEQVKIAEALLWESTVDDAEKPTHETWCRQLRRLLVENDEARPNVTGSSDDTIKGAESVGIDTVLEKREEAGDIARVLKHNASTLPIEEIHDFNQRERDRWVAQKAKSIAKGATVLDVGAGTCRYREMFSHCSYKTHDFKKYEGYRDNKEGLYGEIDYVSSITAIPVKRECFDVVLCTEVLEHVPQPIEALQEISRILKPGGRLFLSAPLGSGLHQQPYHFYGGFTSEWYRHFLPGLGLKIMEIVSNGGFYKMLAQECARVAWRMGDHQHLHGEDKGKIRQLFGELLPRYLYKLDERCFVEQFTVGYHVEAVKEKAGKGLLFGAVGRLVRRNKGK